MERMVQYDALKARWKAELEQTLRRDGCGAKELQRLLNPSYFVDNNNKDRNLSTVDEMNCIEKQQLMFLKIEAQVRDLVVISQLYRTIVRFHVFVFLLT